MQLNETPATETRAAVSRPVVLARRALWPTLTLVTVVAAGAVAVLELPSLHAQSGDAPAASQPPAIPVSVATVAEREIQPWREFSGRLEAVDRVQVRSRVAGQLQAVHFREGELVERGDLLVTIDRAPYAAAVERTEAQVAAAQARVLHTRSEHERARRLLDERSIAQREYDERANNVREAEANLRAAKATLNLARLELGYTQVRAPVSGRIGRIEVTIGNLVSAGPDAPVLTTLVSVSPIYASFEADERSIAPALEVLRRGGGDPASLAGIPVRMGTTSSRGTPFEGRLQMVENRVDARSGTVHVRATFDNEDGSLIPGQFALIRLGQAQDAPAVVVAERAVGTDQDKKYVLVVDDSDKVAWREVTLGAAVGSLRVVRSGLAAGERVVVNGTQRVRPGMLVAPTPVPMDTTAAASAPRS